MGVIVDRNTIRLLQAGTGRAAGLAISPDYALLPFAVVSADGTSLELVSGLATRLVALPTEITTRAATVSLDANGHPIFYEFDRASASDFDDTNRAWFSVDLIDRAGGKPLSAVHAVNYGGARGPFYMVAGIATDGDAVAWERDVNGVWTFRNVTQELARDPLNTALSTVFEITAVHSGGDAQFTGIAIAGMNGRGEVVLYNIDGGRNNFGVLDWFFANISTDQLAPFGAPTPAWTSDVTGYATTWSGVDIVGHDAAGHLQVIWTAPDLHRWFQDDLTDNSGGPATSGAISVVVAPWNTIHIHSLDSSGNLIVTWWDPAFGSHWAVDNLTQETGGPALVSSRGFASFLGVDNSLNIAAHDTSGFIRVYWWRPDQQRWRAGTASSAIDPIQPVTITAGDVAPADDPAHTRPTGSVQSIYGRATNGHFVRLLLVHLRSRQPAR
jgi:hypothetical protein